MQADAARYKSGEVDSDRTGVDVEYYNDGETALIRLGILLARLVKSRIRLARAILGIRREMGIGQQKIIIRVR